MKKITIFNNFISLLTILTVGFSPVISLACEPPVLHSCQLELSKTDSPDPVSPGSQLTYNLTLRNIGTADCTGTGVRIKDVFDPRTTYVSSSITPEEKTSDYIKWNVGTLHPGNSANIDLTMLVSKDAECGSTLTNKAKYWSTQTDWGNFVIEETSIVCLPACGNGVLESTEQCDDGNNIDGDGCSATCETEYVKVKAYKVICQAEADLPNWGTEPGGASINASTAEDYVAASQGKCQTVAGWDFQWGFNGQVQNQDGGFVGYATGSWQNFDTQTTASQPAQVQIGDLEEHNKLWFREVQKEGYIPFSSLPESQKQNNVSAEFYCNNDVLNYDNYEWIDNPELGETYYCVAFNAPTEPSEPFCGDDVINQTSEQCDDGNTANGDGCSAVCQIESTNLLINGTVFNDLNTNGTLDAGESGIANVLITLDGTATSTTNASGTYSFLITTEGIHTVVETDNPSYYSTTPNTVNTTSTIFGHSYVVNFGDAAQSYCGDGVINQTSEQCDDGNATNGDGCSASCVIENHPPVCVGCVPGYYCGDGRVNSGEQCDDGNNTNGDGCSSVCKNEGGGGPYCGDGVKNGGEECDKNDGVSNDYTCTASCKLEKKTCSMDLNAMIVMDVSGSMGYENPSRLSLAKIAANDFLSYLRSNDKSGVVSFSSIVSLRKTLSNDHEASKAVINGLTANGSTNIGDAVAIANQELISTGNSPNLAKIEIILTDGRANRPNGNGFNENSADVALVLAKSLEAAEKGIIMFTIGLGDDINSTMLQNAAENTNGKYYFSPSAGDLKDIFDQIAFETCKSGTTTATSITPAISIFNAKVLSVFGNKVTVSWYTNIPATSRAVYGNQPISVPGDEPNYGYAFSTPEQDSANKVIFHIVTITDLIPGTTYFWRPISHGSPVTVGQESSFKTSVINSQACKKEGESVPMIVNPPACCSGLELIPPKEESILGSLGICTVKCGNGVCDSTTESFYNCSKDCQEAVVLGGDNEQNKKGGSSLGSLLTAGGNFAYNQSWILLVLLAILLVLYWMVSRKKVKKAA